MKIITGNNQSFGKIYMFPLLQEKFYEDAEKYTGLNKREIQKDVESLIEKDINSNECIIKQNASGNFLFESKHGTINWAYFRLANTFRGFIEALENGKHMEHYQTFVKKYKNKDW